MYVLEPAIAARHTGTAYAAVSHAGHGINSYGLNVYIVTQHIAIFVQHGWGGVYNDPAENHATIARTYILLRELLSATKTPAKTRAVLMYSDFRQVAYFFRAASDVLLPLKGRVETLRLAPEISAFRDFETNSSGSDEAPNLTSLELLLAYAALHTGMKDTVGRGLQLLIEAAAPFLGTGPNDEGARE